MRTIARILSSATRAVLTSRRTTRAILTGRRTAARLVAPLVTPPVEAGSRLLLETGDLLLLEDGASYLLLE